MERLRPLLQRWLNDSVSEAGKSRNTNYGYLDFIFLAPPLVAGWPEGKRRKRRAVLDESVRLSLESAFLQNPMPGTKEVTIFMHILQVCVLFILFYSSVIMSEIAFPGAKSVAKEQSQPQQPFKCLD